MAAPAHAEPGDPVLQSTYPVDNSSIKNDPAPPAGPVVTATYDVELDPTSTITVKDNSATPLSGTTSFSQDKKTISFTPSADLSEAGSVYEVTVVAKRDTLQIFDSTDTFRFSIDNTAPAAPSITSVEGDNTSPAKSGDTTPTVLVGSVAAGDTVTLYDGATAKGSKVVPANANSVTFNAAETDNDAALTGDGAHILTAKSRDAATNESAASAPFQYDLDVTPPGAPTIASVEGDTTTPAAGNDTTPQIVVTGLTVGDTVKVYDGNVEKAAKSANAGSMTFNAAETDSDVTLTGDSAHSLTAKAIDAYGNISSASTAFVYNLDTGAPTAPTINSVEGDTSSPAAGADSTPTVVVGGVTAGDVVKIYDGAAEKATKTVPASATTVTFNPGPGETDTELTLTGSGTHSLTAKALDESGNASPASAAFTYILDTTGAPPQLSSTSPANNSTVPTPATVSATYSEPLNTGTSTLGLKNKNNNSVAGTVTFSGDGQTIIFTPGAPLADAGSPYTATANVTDLEGNAAAPTVWTFSVDTTPPAAPTIASVHGDSTTPATGSDTTPAVRITGVTAGDTVKLFDGATEKASKVVPTGATEVIFNSGSATDATLTGDGSHSLTAKATDPHSNTSTASAPFVYDLDTAAPATPAITSVVDDSTSPASGTDPTPKVVVGSVSAGDTVKILDGATQVASKVVPASATTVTFNANDADTELILTGDGAHVLKATATDAAGNVSNASAPYTYNLDATAPALVSTSPASASTVQPPANVSATYGEALNQATSTITLAKTGGSAVAGSPSFTNGAKTIVFTPSAALTQADSPYTATVVAKDAVGNTTNTVFTFSVDTTAPAAPTIASVEGDTTSPASGDDTTPTIVVSGVTAGDTVKIYDGVAERGSRVVPAASTSVTFNPAESDSHVVLTGTGSRTLTAKAFDTAGNASPASNGFLYSLSVAPSPTITGITPASGPRDVEGLVEITGTNFAGGTAVAFSGGGITVDGVIVESPTSLAVLVSIAPAAPLGARDVTVTSGGKSATCTGCFTVLPAQGYTLVGADGGVYNFGTSSFHGSTGSLPLNAPIIGISHTPSGKGYWLVAEDGGIFSYGDAKFHGSTGGMPLNAPVLGMEPTPSGGGYWLFAADGGIFSFGDAKFQGSMGGTPLNAPVVGMAATSSGGGYWLVAQDGGIFSFGDAKFHGSTGSLPLVEPVFDMAALPNNTGYWLVARDGGIFSFGAAKFQGSAVPFDPSRVIGMGSTSSGNGYWIADEDGLVYDFGDAAFLGDLEEFEVNAPIVGFAVVPPAAG